jgi:hypothetical protein
VRIDSFECDVPHQGFPVDQGSRGGLSAVQDQMRKEEIEPPSGGTMDE